MLNDQIKTKISHHGCYGGVVEACYETCEEPICFVNYVTVDSDIVITAFAVHPSSTAKERERAGNEIDAELEREAHKLGNIKRLLIVHPNCDTAEVINTYTPQPFAIGELNNTNPIAHYIN